MPQLTETVFRLDPNESPNDIPRHHDGPKQVRITHILNPYAGNTSQDRAIQELTFETIRLAAKVAAPSITVRCVCVTLAGDGAMVPPDFIRAETLTRTVLDIASFKVERAMPLIFDILDRGVAVAEDPPEISDCDDFIIFTNTDIHLQPHFYLAVLGFIKAGYDVMDIHRRIIPQYAPLVGELPFMFGEHGLHHGGCDCIVFPRRMYKHFIRNNACVGMSYVMRAVVFNCATLAKRYLVSTTARLTFHIGNDRAWADSRFADYAAFNVAEGKRTLQTLAKKKSDVVNLLGALRALNHGGEFIKIVEDTAGLASVQPSLLQLAKRKAGSARKRLLRAIIALLSRWDA